MDVDPAVKVLGGIGSFLVMVGGAWAGLIVARRPGKPDAPAADAPRRPADSMPETIEARMLRAESHLVTCVEDIRRVQDDLDEMRNQIHTIERGAIERAGQTNIELAKLTGALSVRGGRR